MDAPVSGISSFGAWLKQRRKTLDLTREQLADRIGCSLATIAKIEAGERRPSVQLAELLADCLRLPPDQHQAFVELARRGRHTAGVVPSLLTGPAGHETVVRSVHAAPANLPAPITSFVGRQSETEALCRLLPTVRLLTLTGAPGIGKTSLALHVARLMHEQFRDGVFFVPLSPVTGPALVAPAIAGAIGVKDTVSGVSLESLAEHLGSSAVLLLLDNFEHVLDAGPMVARLLAACPGLKVLVTSREALHLYGEQQFPVPPLRLPDPAELPCLRASQYGCSDLSSPNGVSQECVETLLAYPALALFVERARAVQPDFRLREDNAAAVAQTCARLDGLPLAIELAATRVKLLSPAEMLERLDSRLTLLRGGAWDLPARQQTLLGAIEWSFELLNSRDQAAFTRLAVFSGGCTLAAAEAVCNAAGDLGASVLESLQSLLDKNLLQPAVGPRGESRVAMLETVREFALMKLGEARAVDATRKLHMEYYLALAEAAEPEMRGLEGAAWLNRLESDRDNLRLALEWAERCGRTDLGLRLTVALWWFWLTRGPHTEARRWFEVFLSKPSSAATELRAKALNGAGQLAWMSFDYPAAHRYYRESISLAREQGDTRRVAIGLRGLANVARDEGNFGLSRSLYEESLVLFREIGDDEYVGYSLMSMGLDAQRQGELERARGLFEESLAIWQARRDEHGSATCLMNLGGMAYRESDYASSSAFYRESIRVYGRLRETPGLAEALSGLGRATAAEGRATEAVRQFAAAEALLDETGTQLPKEDRAAQDDYLLALRAQLGDAEFEKVWHDGREMTISQLVAYAIGLVPVRG
jgi:predicted ATPase/transcriptional regulator with XRE-family HTH domain